MTHSTRCDEETGGRGCNGEPCCYEDDPALDVRGPDGVSERWKRQFIPPAVRALADEALASRYPKLADEWLPVVQWACIAPEIAGITYGPNYLQLHYQLGAARSSLMIAIDQVRRCVSPSEWQDRISLALLQLRLARSSFVVKPRSAEEWDDMARRRRAEGLVE